MTRDIDDSSENVLTDWSRRADLDDEHLPRPAEASDPRVEETSVEAVAAPQPAIEEELAERESLDDPGS